MKVSKAIILAALLAAGCNSQKEGAAVVAAPSDFTVGTNNSEMKKQASVAMMHIYKTNGDYERYVPVTLNASRTALVAYPSPADVAGSEPVALTDGFLLDRRGVSSATAFTRWTYSQYAALPSAPSPDEIMSNLMPGAAVTEIYAMPFATGTPDAVERCNEQIAARLKDCKLLYKARTFNPSLK